MKVANGWNLSGVVTLTILLMFGALGCNRLPSDGAREPAAAFTGRIIDERGQPIVGVVVGFPLHVLSPQELPQDVHACQTQMHRIPALDGYTGEYGMTDTSGNYKILTGAASPEEAVGSDRYVYVFRSSQWFHMSLPPSSVWLEQADGKMRIIHVPEVCFSDQGLSFVASQ
jgi:hypothetical protein